MASLKAQEAWTQLNDFPLETRGVDSFVLDGTAYVIERAVGNGDHTIRTYNEASDSWTFVATIPTQYKAPFVWDDKVYFFSFSVNATPPEYSVEFWEYDIANNVFIQMNNVLDSFHTFGVFIIESYVLNGVPYALLPGNNEVSENFLKYSPDTDTWTAVAQFPEYYNMSDVISFTLGEEAYAVFGAPDLGPIQPTVFAYSPNTDVWTQKGDFPEEVLEAPAYFVIDDYAYLGTGKRSEISTEIFYRYDPAADVWEQIESCGYPATQSFSFAINGKGYVGSGYSRTSQGLEEQKQVWRLSPEFLSLEETTTLDAHVFPNPVINQLTIETTENIVFFHLMNALGQTIAIEKSLEGLNGQIPNLNAGVYMLKVDTDSQKSAVYRILK